MVAAVAGGAIGVAQAQVAGEGKGTIGVLGLACVDLRGGIHLWSDQDSVAYDECIEEVVRRWELDARLSCVDDQETLADKGVPNLIQGYRAYQSSMGAAVSRIKRDR